MAEIRCEECSSIIPNGAKACPNCGCPVEEKITPYDDKFNNERHGFMNKKIDCNNDQFAVDKSLSNRQVAWNCIRTLALFNKIICIILAIVWFVASCVSAPWGFLIGILLILLAYCIYLIGKTLIAFIAVALETSDDIRKIKNYIENQKGQRQ